MSQSPGSPPDLPSGPPKRFSRTMIALGALVGGAMVLGLRQVALFVEIFIGHYVGLVGIGLALAVPTALGVSLVRRGTPERRGFGLGLLIGWGATTVAVVAYLALVFALVSGM